jgi:NADH dehydrogenase/NADH:ubiquinone oxidoreductase subunit G
MVTFKIDGKTVQAEPETTVLEACVAQGIRIPTLCNLKDVNNIGACRMCLVEEVKTGKLQASCVLPVSQGFKSLYGACVWLHCLLLWGTVSQEGNQKDR